MPPRSGRGSLPWRQPRSPYSTSTRFHTPSKSFGRRCAKERRVVVIARLIRASSRTRNKSTSSLQLSPTSAHTVGRVARLVAYGTIYLAGCRPPEAVELRRTDCQLPAKDWGPLTLSETRPQSEKKFKESGELHDRRRLEQREDDAVRPVPIRLFLSQSYTSTSMNLVLVKAALYSTPSAPPGRQEHVREGMAGGRTTRAGPRASRRPPGRGA
jgi:hypothetical protein